MKVYRNIRDLNQFLGIPFCSRFEILCKIPDSNWDSKLFVLDSSWCRAPRLYQTAATTVSFPAVSV